MDGNIGNPNKIFDKCIKTSKNESTGKEMIQRGFISKSKC